MALILYIESYSVCRINIINNKVQVERGAELGEIIAKDEILIILPDRRGVFYLKLKLLSKKLKYSMLKRPL